LVLSQIQLNTLYLGGIVFIVTVLWTVITLKNTSEELEAFEKTKKPLS
jgi:maltose/moltooligosaccharide transporter